MKNSHKTFFSDVGATFLIKFWIFFLILFNFEAPIAVASVYAHPLEFSFGNLLGVIAGPALSNAHPYTAIFWAVLTLVNTGGAHSGYPIFGCEKHDVHHEFFHYNFGVLGICDYICGAFKNNTNLNTI